MEKNIDQEKIVVHRNEWIWGKKITLIYSGGIGIVNLSIENGEVTIHGLSVIEDCRKNGIGSLLLGRAEEMVKELGYRFVYLSVENREYNSWLLRWYEKKGYRVTGKDKDYIDLFKIITP